LADKADTLVGCFGLGMIPTGAVDPYALRRCALGIARIILEHKLDLDVRDLFRKARDLYGERSWKLGADEALGKLMEFFTLRLKNLFTGQGTATLLVEAALGSSVSDVRRSGARLAALASFSATDAFAPAVMTFKRVANIVRREEQGNGPLVPAYDVSLLAEEAEKVLAAALEKLGPRFDALWNTDGYAELLALLGDLRPAVDAFFDAVMVMAENSALRNNRLGLLKTLESRFAKLADFTALQM
jgi:glycyl-tRNA synthetase beta chain